MANKNVTRQTASIKIDPEIWKEARIEAIKQDIQVSDLVERAVGEWMKKHKK